MRLIACRLTIIISLALTSFASAAPQQASAPSLENQWTALAADHVKPGTIDNVRLNTVDYTALRNDPRWPDLLNTLGSAGEPSSRDAKLAFWINAYNIMAIHVVLQNYPLKSIRDAGGWITPVWKTPAGTVAGKTRTLNEIEHDILRPLGEPRIHAAVVCASVSCPPLRDEAYTQQRLNEQLEDQMRDWLANKQTGALVEDGGKTLRASWIFKHFRSDFETGTQTLADFLTPRLPDSITARLKPGYTIKALPYDWSLNDAERATSDVRGDK